MEPTKKHNRLFEVCLGAIVLATLVAVVCYDLSHVYAGHRLMEKRASLDSAAAPQTAAEIAVISHCLWMGEDQAQAFAKCLRDGLPKLKTGPGMLMGVTKAGTLLSHHPDDKVTQALAEDTMERLWDQYWHVDRPIYRMVDQASHEMNQSVLYRMGHAGGPGCLDFEWMQLLKSAELLVSDPALAKKQFERQFAYESREAQAYAASRTHSVQ
ncbi:hypothetical protein [Paraburkholderia youngii]|uniref:hypothetical protein n=1 Tax=Paraburkholderia youngii TaxID=2782701 RepID=UPI003D1C2BCE